VIVSNHGGRQLDYLPGTAQVLPEVTAAVGDRMDVLVDGGIRRGSDVVKALALGAKAVLLGRPWLHALAAGGAPAVEDLLRMLTVELDRTMALVGCADVRDLTADVVRTPARSAVTTW
jgi:isopentenyl diphosphate isomerase/L-lactate dehydrogenase-like FMN-dependent dehydrogenase